MILLILTAQLLTTVRKRPAPVCRRLEYVILHEFVHLVKKKHNEWFVSLMDNYISMWREVKMTLNGQTLNYIE